MGGSGRGTVPRFNIYGLKYSRNHTGGGECAGRRGRYDLPDAGGSGGMEARARPFG